MKREKDENTVIRETASAICNTCTFTPFCTECDRKDWGGERRTLPKFGKGSKCPLLRFEAERYDKNHPGTDLRSVTYETTWLLCSRCEHAVCKEDVISIPEDNFIDYCMDCAVLASRDCAAEAHAEAAGS